MTTDAFMCGVQLLSDLSSFALIRLKNLAPSRQGTPYMETR